MAVPVIGTVLKKVFGTRNERMVKHYLTRVRQINDREADYVNLTDAELKELRHALVQVRFHPILIRV